MVLLILAANAQTAGNENGKRHQKGTQKVEDPAKKKADEKEYNDALKRIPTSTEKADPWKSMR